MTKYIIIAGVPRAGKSTVSKMIAMDSGEYDECDYGVVIDVYQLLPKDYVTHICGNDCKIYYFLSSDTTPEERFHILKEHDTPDDYTYYHSDEENKKDCVDIVNISRMIKEQCISYGLPYYETSYERDKVLAMFMTEHIKCV